MDDPVLNCQFCGKETTGQISVEERDAPGPAMFCSWFCVSAWALKEAKEQSDRQRAEISAVQQCPHCGEAF